jgi:hypothetical protein
MICRYASSHFAAALHLILPLRFISFCRYASSHFAATLHLILPLRFISFVCKVIVAKGFRFSIYTVHLFHYPDCIDFYCYRLGENYLLDSHVDKSKSPSAQMMSAACVPSTGHKR